MTTESSQPQETEPDTGETTPRDHDEPNEFAFSGDATAPQPERDGPSSGEGLGESVAVPAGDLTGAVSAAIEDATTEDEPAER